MKAGPGLRETTQYFRTIGFLNPAASNAVRVCACVAASLSGPTKTRNTPSFGAGAMTVWKPFLPRVSVMISASGRAVATTCQYSPGARSAVTDAAGEAGGRGDDFAFCAGGAGAGVGAAAAGGATSLAGCVPVSAGAGLAGSGAGVVAAGLLAESAAFESAGGGQCITAGLLSRALSATVGAELRPTMYPMEKNTPSRITTMRKTLMS